MAEQIKSERMENMDSQCAEPGENAGRAITCSPARMQQEEKNLQLRKQFSQTSQEKKKKQKTKTKRGSRSCLPSQGHFQRAGPTLLPLHMHTLNR